MQDNLGIDVFTLVIRGIIINYKNVSTVIGDNK